jgi:hypothetical protein
MKFVDEKLYDLICGEKGNISPEFFYISIVIGFEFFFV